MLTAMTGTGIHQQNAAYFILHINFNNCLFCRGEYGRIQTCKLLNDLGYHVFALDYRGYGDSTGEPSETGIVNDVINLHNFIKSYQKEAQIHLWGHSLGTGVVCHAGKILTEFGCKSFNR
jgi:pimeloyl-ACP methyl ester carboxylesterase